MLKRIGDVIANSDGSFNYLSHKGVLNLDNSFELEEAVRKDKSFLKQDPSFNQANKSAKEKIDSALNYL